jgi:hypothetical protein
MPDGNGQSPSMEVPAFQPVPTVIVIGEQQRPDERKVTLEFHTPAGVGVYFLDPDRAVAIGTALQAAGARGPGLFLPDISNYPPEPPA